MRGVSEGRIVYRRWLSFYYFHPGNAAVRPCRILHDLAGYLSQRFAIGGIEGAERAPGLGDARYDVLGGSSTHPTDAEDRGVRRIQPAAHQRLQGDDGVREGEYGVVRAVGIGTVAAGSLDDNAQVGRGRREASVEILRSASRPETVPRGLPCGRRDRQACMKPFVAAKDEPVSS